MTTAIQPASVGMRVGAVAIDLLVMADAGLIGWFLTDSWGVAAVVAVEAGIVLWLARAVTGRTPGAFVTRIAAHVEGTDRAPGLRLRGVRVSDLRPKEAPATHLDDYGRETTNAAAWPGEELPKAPKRQSVTSQGYPGPALLGPAPSHPRAAAPTQQTPPPPQMPSTAPTQQTSTQQPPQQQPNPWQQMRAPDGDPQRQQQFIQPSPQPARAQQPQTPHGEVPGSLWLLADTGQRCEVRGVVVLGRAPEASAVNGELGFEVNDPTRSLSRNHARVGRDDQGLWVEDAHSSNGTAIRTPDGQIIAVQPGNRMRIHPGATLLLGDRTVQVSTV